jgi:zinc transport system permease protein
MWGRWAYATFDRELAQADGITVQRDDYLLVALIAVTVVVAVKLVGIVMIAAFLVIPSATSRLLSRSFGKMTALAMLLGGASVVGGLWCSVLWNIPSGATIILVQSTLFFGGIGLSVIRSR